mmetsp:Transcript_22202/g.48430  ORF Transcript_22202/g.48430 Transcript_22202/m.48430 type:complete len:128 (-) Transcript_22202:423-806(-)
MELPSMRKAAALSPMTATLVAAAYALLAATVVVVLSWMLYHYPLLDFAVDDIFWTRSWLYMTVLDYYGSTFVVCGIIFSTEPLVNAVLWSLACCILGSPFCCFYVLWRLYQHRTLRLCDANAFASMD